MLEAHRVVILNTILTLFITKSYNGARKVLCYSLSIFVHHLHVCLLVCLSKCFFFSTFHTSGHSSPSIHMPVCPPVSLPLTYVSNSLHVYVFSNPYAPQSSPACMNLSTNFAICPSICVFIYFTALVYLLYILASSTFAISSTIKI